MSLAGSLYRAPNSPHSRPNPRYFVTILLLAEAEVEAAEVTLVIDLDRERYALGNGLLRLRLKPAPPKLLPRLESRLKLDDILPARLTEEVELRSDE